LDAGLKPSTSLTCAGGTCIASCPITVIDEAINANDNMIFFILINVYGFDIHMKRKECLHYFIMCRIFCNFAA